ncbi:hypothetical protein DPEC_G00311090 [Dallia pectoralis]|uniref:Uncharacterized protein n=1 Tax=Dallia pectoralis TaxID=75939 RepID=A0ACC2FBA8_DALPE|nr:hypothetical protein DPEC_G00311090 [Dallia pectoralis]
MTPTEQRYAQVEEALAATWACERFGCFILGRPFELETDHKPLVSLLGGKALDDLPPRIQRFKMRLMSNIPVSGDYLSSLRENLKADSTCSALIEYCTDGWPDKSQLQGSL